MTSLADQSAPVTGGVDTHRDFHLAVVVDSAGRVLGTERFEADARGYSALLAWMRTHGPVGRVGVEGTGSYGAGLARHLASQGVEVVEVVRPNRQVRRRRGKSDPTDAEAAARAALSGEACGRPKARTGAAEGLRALMVARRGVVKAATQAANQLHALVVSAPDDLRQRLERLGCARLAAVAAKFRVGPLEDPYEATRAALRSVARRYLELKAEQASLDAAIGRLLPLAAPEGFLDKRGVGPIVAATLIVAVGDNPERLGSEASFAALCGVSPVDASSGKQVRHRLNRGGDRQANSALWRIVFTRLRTDPKTKAFAARKRAEGHTDREIVRCLKRYVAREVYQALVATAAGGTQRGGLNAA